MWRSLLVVWLAIVVSCAPSRPTMDQSYNQAHHTSASGVVAIGRELVEPPGAGAAGLPHTTEPARHSASSHAGS